MSEVLNIDDLHLQVRRSHRRKTLQITVERDGSLIAAIPAECDLDRLRSFAEDRREWIYGKLAMKRIQIPIRQPMRFQAGQGVYYLGRSYRIQLLDDEALALRNGRFCLPRHGKSKQVFVDWLCEHGRQWLETRLSHYSHRYAVQPSGITVADIGYRWGSCSRNRTLNFHWKVVQLPPHAIDYVICHELAHLAVQHHTPAFWGLLERVLPDYASRKDWLAQHGAEYVLQV